MWWQTKPLEAFHMATHEYNKRHSTSSGRRTKTHWEKKKLGTCRFLPHKHQTESKRISFSGKQCRALYFTSQLYEKRQKNMCLSRSSSSSLPPCRNKVSEPSEEANQALALLDLLLDLITGGGDLSLCGEDSANEGEHGATHGSVEGPAHGAEPGPVRWRIRTAVQLDLVRTPASRVQHQTQDQKQTCRQGKQGEGTLTRVLIINVNVNINVIIKRVYLPGSLNPLCKFQSQVIVS